MVKVDKPLDGPAKAAARKVVRDSNRVWRHKRRAERRRRWRCFWTWPYGHARGSTAYCVSCDARVYGASKWPWRFE